MIRVLAAALFLWLTPAQACTPQIAFESRARDMIDQKLFDYGFSIRAAGNGDFVDRIYKAANATPLPNIEIIYILFDLKRKQVALFPLQRLTPNDDLTNCKWLVMDRKVFDGIFGTPA
jgi:hypothetical protein